MSSLRLLAIPITLITSVFLARVLGAENYGHYAFILSLGTLVSLPVGQGVTQLLTREIARSHGSVHISILSWAWRRLAIYTTITFTLSIVAWYIFRSEILLDFIAASIIAPLIAGYQIFGGATRGYGASVSSQIPEMLARPVGGLIFSYAVWTLFGLSLESALATHIIGTLLGLIISYAILARNQRHDIQLIEREENIKSWNKSSISFSLISATNFMNIEFGIIGLGILGLPAEASGMRISQSGAQLVMLSLVAVDLVTQSKLAMLARQNNQAELRSTYVGAARLAFMFSFVVALPLILFPEPLIGMAFGEEYVSLAAVPLSILSIMQVVNAVFGASGTLLNMSGNERQALRAQIISIFFTVPGVFIFGSLYGSTGAAFAILAGMVVKKILESYYVFRWSGTWLHAFSREI